MSILPAVMRVGLLLLPFCSASGSQGVGSPGAPYGTWRSPLTAAQVTKGALRFDHIVLDDKDVYWLEERPAEGGRSVVVKRLPDGRTVDVSPAQTNVRSRVHEYGGAAYAVHHGTLFYSNFSDQRVYRLTPGGQPEPLTPPGYYYADFRVDTQRNRLLAIREDHTAHNGEPTAAVVAFPMHGGAGDVLVAGADFYAHPVMSPDSSQLAWLQWNHPNMPWDSSEVWTAEVHADGTLGAKRQVAGGAGESIFQPEWSPDGLLYFVSDRSGWWNLYRNRAGVIEPVHPMAAEFGKAQWSFSSVTYTFAGPDRLVATYTQDGQWRMALIDVHTGAFQTLRLRFAPHRGLAAQAQELYYTGTSPTEPTAVVSLNLESLTAKVLRRAGEEVDSGYLSTPMAMNFPTSGGLTAHAFFYAPKNKDYVPSATAKPPLIVIGHGGPTDAASYALDLHVQFWTSRGFSVVDVNYGGSTGFGTAYRRRLNGQWGSLDVADCVNAARYLVQQGKADGNRLIIRGGSAGGYTALTALTQYDLFKAGASYYGISDIEVLARDTHKFESRYLESLLGPYPESRALYRQRSPLTHIDKLSAALILLQGLEDKVVPPNQSEAMAQAARRKGLPVAYLTFAGEQHGFRKSSSNIAALEAELYFYGAVFGFRPADTLIPIKIDNLPSKS